MFQNQNQFVFFLFCCVCNPFRLSFSVFLFYRVFVVMECGEERGHASNDCRSHVLSSSDQLLQITAFPIQTRNSVVFGFLNETKHISSFYYLPPFDSTSIALKTHLKNKGSPFLNHKQSFLICLSQVLIREKHHVVSLLCAQRRRSSHHLICEHDEFWNSGGSGSRKQHRKIVRTRTRNGRTPPRTCFAHRQNIFFLGPQDEGMIRLPNHTTGSGKHQPWLA
jgi:hypothetical protein